jgi:hypothetical protein
MRKYLSAALALLLCSCSTISHTKDPAASYAATEVHRGKNGALQIVGDHDIAYQSSTIAVPTTVFIGLTAAGNKTSSAYACYLVVSKWLPKASSLARTPADFERKMRYLPSSRAAMDTAASGPGLTIPLPEWHTQHVFSAAYVRGFLQKVDETFRNPAAAKIVE